MANSTEPLGQYAQAWKRKPVLRLIYDDFYDRLVAHAGRVRPSRSAAASAT